jgi:hypothetical protein
MNRSLLALLIGLCVASSSPAQHFHWQTDNHAALDTAETERKLAFLWFFDAARGEDFQVAVAAPEIASLVEGRFIAARLPVEAKITSQGESIRLLDHAAFADLKGGPGLAIIDMTDAQGPHFRQVVSIYPLADRTMTLEKLKVLLTLPCGTLTQRTLIYAVRTHPEHPASTDGHLSQLLTRETENHAWHQASIGLQGHHHWDARFHWIGAQLPGNLAAREVCAESWPGQSLLDAAEECVHSWRQSPGHWEAVSSRHALYAYDMKRGARGIWYATGIFAGR